MPEMKHNFQKGRMNKDLDERVVPDGEYKEALNIEVSTSEDSDVGTLQTMMGNTLLSSVDPSGTLGFICVGSIEDSRNNKLYWFATSTIPNPAQQQYYDIVAEYDYTTGDITPVCVDVHFGTNRVLKFNTNFHITGLNVMDGVLYWTDNNSEPKKINIERCKEGTVAFDAHTDFMVKDIDVNAIPGSFVNSGPIREEHLTIIKRGPLAAPVLVMQDTLIEDLDLDNLIGGSEINTSITNVGSEFIDANTGELVTSITITTTNSTDFPNGAFVEVYSLSDTIKKVRAQITSPSGGNSYDLTVFSGNKDINDSDDLYIRIEQNEPLFQFKFPRFATRYKYEDGEYSPFSPFSEVAFLPKRFDYMPKEGYNLGMVNNLRKLAIKNFVYKNGMPEDVIAVDILYKESNSSNVYSVKQIKRTTYDPTKWDSWNGNSLSTVSNDFTKGYLPITSEMIHAVLPANQLLRPWDNVPRKALAQEIIGNRLIYGNYLQNYNLDNEITGEHNIKAHIVLSYISTPLGNTSPEEVHAGDLIASTYKPAKSIKTLRTYQAGIIYIDRYGRETPVLSEGDNSIYLPKESADQQTQLVVRLNNQVHPDWATHYKIFIKETSNEYYNLAMDRWYDAEDDNIWLSFPSAERNKVDEETFLILKKEHDTGTFVSDPARYKIIAIENEAPRFIKLRNISMGGITDGSLDGGGTRLGLQGAISTFPYTGGTDIYVEPETFKAAGWLESLVNQDISQCFIRVKTGSAISGFYRLKQISVSSNGYYILRAGEPFGDDMSITSPTGFWQDRIENCELQIIKRIPEDRAEFEGRFFVKILKDPTLIERLGTSGTQIEHMLTRMSRQVQYINPKVDPGLVGSHPTFYGQVGSNSNASERYRIHRDSRNSSIGYTKHPNASNGKGSVYWKHAANCDVGNDSESSGWFIDGSEGFVPGPWTHNLYGNDNSYRFNRATDLQYLWGCSGTPFGSERQSYEDDYPPKLQSVHGINSFGGSWGDLTYLGIWNLRPPIGSTGVNNVTREEKINGGKKSANSGGIDGNFIFLSYAGLNSDTESNNSGNGKSQTNFADIDFYFDDATKHTSDLIFIEKLTQAGCVFAWAEDPGQVFYMTENLIDTPYEDDARDFIDGSRPGAMMYNYTNFVDYYIENHYDERLTYFCFGDDDCTYEKETIVSRPHHNDLNAHNSPQLYPGNQGSIGFTCGSSCGACECDWCFACDLFEERCPEENLIHRWGAYESDTSEYGIHHVWPSGVYDWNSSWNKRRRFVIKAVPLDPVTGEKLYISPGVPQPIGSVGPHFYKPTNNPDYDSHFDYDINTAAAYPTILTANPLTGVDFEDYPGTTGYAPGLRSDGMHSGYEDPGGNYVWNNGEPTDAPWHWDTLYNGEIPNYKRWSAADATTNNRTQSRPPGSVTWQIKEYFVQEAEDNSYTSTNPAIWETEPKEDVGLDIYYEVGQIYPLELNNNTIEQHVGAVQFDISKNSYVKCQTFWGSTPVSLIANGDTDIRVIFANDSSVVLGNVNGDLLGDTIGDIVPPNGSILTFYRADGSSTASIVINGATAATTTTPGDPENQLHPNTGSWLGARIPWFNCYSFGNGVESDRVRDDYNQVKIDNGPKASTVLEETYLEERRCSGFIWSGIYNSNSGVNDLNQFIQAEAITKDVNPGYGCVQKMHARDNDLVAFCEDRVLKVHANKDALFNADGNTNLVATNKVLGAVKPFSGDYGISKNPESFASDSYRSYFADASRGAVLRLSQDGLTPISDAGMKDWFADILPRYAKISDHKIIGSFDDKKQEYNITLTTDIDGGICGTSETSAASVPCSESQILSATPWQNSSMTYNQGDVVSYQGNYYFAISTGSANVAPGTTVLGVPAKWALCNGNTIVDGTIIQNIEDETNYTLAYSESSKGWTSFRSYLQESGVSLNNEYFTFKGGELYLHHDNQDRNNYYTNQYDSYVSILLNRAPSIVKSFTTVNYEGSQARITEDLNNPDYYDNTAKDGWYVSKMTTDLQEVDGLEFISKEEKYFSQIRGVKTIWTEDGLAGNVDPSEFSFQGIGTSYAVSCPDCAPTVSWNCQGTPCECVEISGSQGQYPTQAACLNDTSGCCGDVETWCCIDGNCINPGDGSGDYSTLCECVLNSNCCDEGSNYLDCMGLPTPSPYIVGCMDDGITTDPFMTQDRPAGWVGPATNYDLLATVPDCSCLYETPPTYDCREGECEDPLDGSGQYTGPNALNDCITDCADPCDGQNMGIDKIIVNPTPTGPPNNPCETASSDGSVQIMVDNQNPTSLTPFTSWQWELYDDNNTLIYSDPNWYATGTYSNVYIGLTTIQAGTTAYGIYYAKIIDNNDCEYGPFSITVDCVEEQCTGFGTLPGWDWSCCDRCAVIVPANSFNDPCWDFCQNWWSPNSWEDCCQVYQSDPCPPADLNSPFYTQQDFCHSDYCLYTTTPHPDCECCEDDGGDDPCAGLPSGTIDAWIDYNVPASSILGTPNYSVNCEFNTNIPYLPPLNTYGAGGHDTWALFKWLSKFSNGFTSIDTRTTKICLRSNFANSQSLQYMIDNNKCPCITDDGLQGNWWTDIPFRHERNFFVNSNGALQAQDFIVKWSWEDFVNACLATGDPIYNNMSVNLDWDQTHTLWNDNWVNMGSPSSYINGQNPNQVAPMPGSISRCSCETCP